MKRMKLRINELPGCSAARQFIRLYHWKPENLLHHEGHEGNEVNPGSAGRLTGFMHFAFGDQRLAVGSRPAGRRWRVRETIVCLQGKPWQFKVHPCIPPPKLFLTDGKREWDGYGGWDGWEIKNCELGDCPKWGVVVSRMREPALRELKVESEKSWKLWTWRADAKIFCTGLSRLSKMSPANADVVWKSNNIEDCCTQLVYKVSGMIRRWRRWTQIIKE